MPGVEGKTWDELEVLESSGRLLFPDSIKRRGKTRQIEEVAICIRVLRKDEKRAARLEARAWASKLGVDVEKDRDIFEDLDTLCILARAIRERAAPHEQHQQAEWLESHYDSGSLAQIWDRLSVYEQMIDPRLDEMSEDDFWRTVLSISSTRSPKALTDFVPRLQQSFIISMADQVLLSPTLKSFVASRDSSTAEPSPSKDSSSH